MSEDISNSKIKHRQDVRASRSTKNHSLLNPRFSRHKSRTPSRPGATFLTSVTPNPLLKKTPLSLWLPSSLIIKKYRCAGIFVFNQLLKRQLYFVGIFCCFGPRARTFYSQLKRALERRQFV